MGRSPAHESQMTDTRRRAVLFDVDKETSPPRRDAEDLAVTATGLDPASAPPVPDDEAVPNVSGRAMQTVALLATRRERGLAGWFFGLLGALVTFAISVAMWQFVTDLISANPLLGWVALALVAAFLTICLVIILR